MYSLECPVCDKKVTVPHRGDAPYRPFCSERCKLVDLGRWLDGSYAVGEPVGPTDEADEAAEPSPNHFEGE